MRWIDAYAIHGLARTTWPETSALAHHDRQPGDHSGWGAFGEL